MDVGSLDTSGERRSPQKFWVNLIFFSHSLPTLNRVNRFCRWFVDIPTMEYSPRNNWLYRIIPAAFSDTWQRIGSALNKINASALRELYRRLPDVESEKNRSYSFRLWTVDNVLRGPRRYADSILNINIEYCGRRTRWLKISKDISTCKALKFIHSNIVYIPIKWNIWYVLLCNDCYSFHVGSVQLIYFTCYWDSHRTPRRPMRFDKNTQSSQLI